MGRIRVIPKEIPTSQAEDLCKYLRIKDTSQLHSANGDMKSRMRENRKSGSVRVAQTIGLAPERCASTRPSLLSKNRHIEMMTDPNHAEYGNMQKWAQSQCSRVRPSSGRSPRGYFSLAAKYDFL